MPIELAGISNVNEFYSEHYLQTVFEGDVQELRTRWRAEEKAGGNPADRQLEKAGARWRRLVSDYKANAMTGSGSSSSASSLTVSSTPSVTSAISD